jgi:hypothetical protein
MLHVCVCVCPFLNVFVLVVDTCILLQASLDIKNYKLKSKKSTNSVGNLVVNIYVESRMFCRYIICATVYCSNVLVSSYRRAAVDLPYSLFSNGQYRTVAVWVVVPSH